MRKEKKIPEEVKKVLLLDEDDGSDKEGENKVFHSYCEANVIGEKILKALWEKRGEYQSNVVGRHNIDWHTSKMFYSDSRNKYRLGYLCDVYGCTAVFNIINRMVGKEKVITKVRSKEKIVWHEKPIELTDEQRREFKNSIYNIMDSVDEYGYNLYPYISSTLNNELFPKFRPYVGAMTWTLSLLTSVWNAHVKGLIKLDTDGEKNRLEQLSRQVADIVEKFVDNVITDGDAVGLNFDGKNEREAKLTNGTPLGWGYTSGCETPSLFFTYSVLEAYSDFEDSVLIYCDSEATEENKTELNKLADELINKINRNRVVKWRLMCEKIADNVWDNYKTALKSEFVDDTFFEYIGTGDNKEFKPFSTISEADILKSNSSNALFNNIHLVFILFYGYANKREGRSEDEKEDIVATMNAALRNVQKMYRRLCDKDCGYLVENYIINFKQRHKEDGDKYLQALSSERLIDATIVPLLVKANNMIAFHIEKYPIKEMRGLFLNLFREMTPNEWLWDGTRYDVKITDRYIEAIADFYDYYNVYEKTYVELDKEKQTAVEEITKRKDQEIADLKRSHQETIETLKGQLDKANKDTEARYKVEGAIRSLIDERALSSVKNAFEHIIACNNEGAKLSSDEENLKDLIYQLLFSYIGRMVLGRYDAEKADKVKESLEKQLKDDIKNRIEEIAKNLK